MVWPRSQPGNYRIVADDVARGIDDAGRVVTEKGFLVSSDGTTSRIVGSPQVVVEEFQSGQVLGHKFSDHTGLWRWDIATGAAVQRYEMKEPTPIGINGSGLLASWSENPGGGRITVKVWRGATFEAELAVGERVRAVTETNELAGQRKAADGRWAPAIWTCS